MKKNILILLLLISKCCFGQDESLFIINEHGKVGYINSKGEKIINPVFLNGGNFSEGLAPVRINGYFGFIDESGKFVIPAIYDYAVPFNHGWAKVYKDGMPVYIDKKNKNSIGKPYKSLWILNNHQAIATTYGNRKGVIDLKTGTLLIDTLYSQINPPYKGVYVVEKFIPKSEYNPYGNYSGLIDSTGHYIVPFGKYYRIRNFDSDYTLVNIRNPNNKKERFQGAIDLKGNLLFKREIIDYENYNHSSYIEGNFHDGLARISLYKDWLPITEGENPYKAKQYFGYINTKGEIVLNDTLNKSVSDFNNGIAYAYEFNGSFKLITTHFEKLNSYPLGYVHPFSNGEYFRIVSDKKSGIINNKGALIVKPHFKHIHEFGIERECYIFSNDTVADKKLYGLADMDSNILLNPCISVLHDNGFKNGLMKCVINSKESYINKKGKIVWQEKEEVAPVQKMNIDYMKNPSYYAINFDPNNTPNPELWLQYYQYPKAITSEIHFEKDKLSVYIDTLESAVYRKNYLGHKLYVTNATNQTIAFNTSDNNISMKLQAKAKNGEWKDIEYLEPSGCGNSYYKTDLSANKYWDFTIPNYDGALKTKVRAELKYISNSSNKQETVYSNEIDAGINPAQFWKNDSYYYGF